MTLGYLVNTRPFKLAVEKGIVRRDAFKAMEDAGHLIRECKALTERLRREARETREAERKRGFEEGKREALTQASSRLVEIEVEAARYLGALDAKLVELAVQIVRRIAPRVGAQQVVPDLVEQALREVHATSYLMVRVHPDCREQVTRRLDELRPAYPGIEIVEVLVDATIDPFACSLESEAGIVRADLELQLRALEQGMRQSVAR